MRTETEIRRALKQVSETMKDDIIAGEDHKVHTLAAMYGTLCWVLSKRASDRPKKRKR